LSRWRDPDSNRDTTIFTESQRGGIDYERPANHWRRASGYLEGLEDDGKDGGLILVCLNTDFQRQFEVVQAQWCDDGTAFRLGSDKHYLLGDSQGMREVTIQGHPPHFARAQPLVLVTRGCVYLVMPRVGALCDLAGR
jgi:hypothetical protein